MGFICNDGEALALRGSKFLHGFESEREGLEGADDDLLAPGEGFGEFAALAGRFAGDGGDDAGGAAEIEDGFLELGVKDSPVGDDEDGVEELFVLRVVEISKEVFFATDEVAMRALERIDVQILAVDSMSALQTPAQ